MFIVNIVGKLLYKSFTNYLLIWPFLIKYLWCPQNHTNACQRCLNSIPPTSLKQVLLSKLCRWGNWCPKTLRKLSKIFSFYAMGFIFKYYDSGIHTNYTLVPKIFSFGHLLLNTRFSHKEEKEKKSFSLLQQITVLLANSVNAQAFTEDVYKLGSINLVFFLDTIGCRCTKVSWTLMKIMIIKKSNQMT